MIIDGTSDTIRFKLGSAVTTNELPFVVDYNNFTASAVTPTKNTGQSNGTTVVTLVPSPSASQQNKLMSASIQNADTVNATVKVEIYDGSNARQAFQCVLGVNDTLMYDAETGWEVINTLGQKTVTGMKVIASSMRTPEFMQSNTAGSSGGMSAAGARKYAYLGKADKAYTTISIQYNVVTGATATIAWAEFAIYKASITTPILNASTTTSIGQGLTYKNTGFVDTSAIWTGTGRKTTAITTSGINVGDDLFLVYAISTSGGAWAPRIMSNVDDLLMLEIGTMAVSGQPSTFTYNNIATQTGSGNYLWFMWQGV